MACAKIGTKIAVPRHSKSAVPENGDFCAIFPTLRCFPNVKTCLESSGYNKFGINEFRQLKAIYLQVEVSSIEFDGGLITSVLEVFEMP